MRVLLCFILAFASIGSGLKTRDAPETCWAECLASLPHPWVLFAGDSNWRMTYERLVLRLGSVNGFHGVRATTVARYPQESYEEKMLEQWFDRDMIFTDREDGRFFRISLRFVSNAELFLSRVATGSDWWPQVRQCGLMPDKVRKEIGNRTAEDLRPLNGTLTSTDGWTYEYSCSGDRFVAKQEAAFSGETWQSHPPHTVVFTHGLWGLPENGKDYLPFAAMSRGFADFPAERHQYIGAQLQQWMKNVPNFFWATNFFINYHKTIRNEHIMADRLNQYHIAQTLGVPMLDVQSYVKSTASDVSDFHIKESVQDAILKDLMQGMCPACVDHAASEM